MKKYVLFFSTVIVLLSAGTLIWFNTTDSKDNQNEVIMNEERLKEYVPQIQEYIEAQYKTSGDRIICSAVKPLGHDKKLIYLYVYIAEYCKNGSKIQISNASYTPMALSVCDDEELKIEKILLPEDGTKYGESMQKIFPENIILKISMLTEKDMGALKVIADERAEAKLGF